MRREDEYVTEWWTAMRGTGFVAGTHAEQRASLRVLLGEMVDILTAERFDPMRAYRVGRRLVDIGFATPEVVGRSVKLMQLRIPRLVTDYDPERLADLIAQFSVGFTMAMNDRSLDAQEDMRLAALSARAKAENALRESEARFRHFATHDQFTGLPNRTRFIERLGELVDRDVHLAVCCIDLDGFGKVNDTFGYQVGDRVLSEAAGRLQHMAAAYTGAGCEVFRFDRDEFGVLLEGVAGPEEAGKVADLAIGVLSEPFHIDDHELPMSASVGVMETVTMAVERDEMLRHAEIALHWAKADGQGCWRLFEPDRSADDARRFRLSAAMPAALRRGEFSLAYQPLVNLTDGRLSGVEALARWNHPTMGQLSAGQFIGLAEDTGVVVAMDDLLLEQACRQAERWVHLSSEPPYIAVNLAARQLHRPGLVGYVAQVLTSTGLPPENLQLEITEHAAVGTDQQVVNTLNELARLGVHIAIDDFGTGYSNLSSLRGLPVHALKLDATFASNRRGNPDRIDQEFIAMLVAMGHTLGLQVVAEGIERLWQARRMRDAGCDLGQGYLFGKPAPSSEIERLVAEGRCSILGPAARPSSMLTAGH